VKARGRSVHEYGAMDPSYHCLLDSYLRLTAVVMKRLIKNNKTEQKAKDKGGFILNTTRSNRASSHYFLFYYLRAVKRRRREKGVRTPFSYLCRVKIFTCEKNLLLAKNLKGAP